jgi:hypothetical protein
MSLIAWLLRRWQVPAWVALFTVLGVNAWYRAGTVALVIVALAGLGCAFLVAVIALLAGGSAASHSIQEKRAIRKVLESHRRRELTR